MPKSKLFSYLPLEQASPLPFHINGYWALHQENRQRIYEYCMRDKNVNAEMATWCTDWNLCIINDIILPLFVQLLEYLKQHQFTLQFGPDSFLSLFPNKNSLDKMLLPYFEPMFSSFYKQIQT